MIIDLIYVAHNRHDFTVRTLAALMENTDWSRVRCVHVYDDDSIDGTREMLAGTVAQWPNYFAPAMFHEVDFGSPVEVMNDYIANHGDSDAFVKIDNDIMVPPGWLEALTDTLDAHPELDVLGMEAGRMGVPPEGFAGPWEADKARWIGGVGIIRTRLLSQRPRIRAAGRFGWTEFQQEYRPNIAWIKPDLLICELSRIPFEPWRSLTAGYVEREWDRDWPKYHERWCAPYWSWWAPEEVPDDV